MEDTQKRMRSGKRVLGVLSRGSSERAPNSSPDILENLKKGEILHLRDDFRPYMRTRDWVFQDLFKGGGVFLHHDVEGFLEVKVKDIDWEAYMMHGIRMGSADKEEDK